MFESIKNIFVKNKNENGKNDKIIAAIKSIDDVEIYYRICGGMLLEQFRLWHVANELSKILSLKIGKEPKFEFVVDGSSIPKLIREIGVWPSVKVTINWIDEMGNKISEKSVFTLRIKGLPSSFEKA